MIPSMTLIQDLSQDCFWANGQTANVRSHVPSLSFSLCVIKCKKCKKKTVRFGSKNAKSRKTILLIYLFYLFVYLFFALVICFWFKLFPNSARFFLGIYFCIASLFWPFHK